MSFWSNHKTKALGSAVALVSGLALMTTNMSFDGLLEPATIRWIAIVCNLLGTVLGVWTVGIGSSNTTQIRVAEAEARVAAAMDTALRTQPPTQSSLSTSKEDLS